MNVTLFQFSSDRWTSHPSTLKSVEATAQLVLCFATKDILASQGIYQEIRRKFPKAEIAICSTAGEIYQDTVLDDSMIVVAIEFAATTIKTSCVNIRNFENSLEAGSHLKSSLLGPDLTYIMVLSDGSLVNGSELVKGFNADENRVLITGGLAGDAANFKSTLVGLNAQPAEGQIVAIGFYGTRLAVTHGSQGGWENFGLEKQITKSTGNVLFQIDEKDALDMYKKYLGAEADNLPGSALLFPLSVIIPGAKEPVVRTILSIDELNKSMTFAGDVPEGSKVKFMKANLNRLITAASTAAQQTFLSTNKHPDFSLLVSCVGRKLVLGPRIDEEVQTVIDTFDGKTPLAGFYSYGEISPVNNAGICQLQNQTMTITSFYELP